MDLIDSPNFAGYSIITIIAGIIYDYPHIIDDDNVLLWIPCVHLLWYVLMIIITYDPYYIRKRQIITRD